MRLHIRPQCYPTCTGECPLSWAIWYGNEFLCYSWSLRGALEVFAMIRKTLG